MEKAKNIKKIVPKKEKEKKQWQNHVKMQHVISTQGCILANNVCNFL
jgi:hypothetical protein